MENILNILYTSIFIFCSTKKLLIERLTLKQYIIFFLVTYISLFTTVFIGNIGLIIMVLSVTIYLAYCSQNRLSNICCFFAGYIICIVAANIIAPTFIYVFKSDISLFQADTFQGFLSAIVTFIFIYITTHILGSMIQKKFSKIENKQIPPQYTLLILINLLVCLLILAFNIIMGEKAGYTFDILLFNGIIFVVYFILSTVTIILSMRSYISQTEAAMKQRTFENLQNYTKKIETMYSQLRSFKHDYVNIMSSMSGYIENKDLDGLEVYFSEKIIPLRKNIDQTNSKLNQLMNIHILELKSLLSLKLIYANERGINVSVDILTPVEHISIDIIDLTRVIGIYMDNAIEAAIETVHPELSLGIITFEHSIAIVISNTFIDHGIPLHTINQHSVSSKGPARGIGLFNAMEIVNKYSNITRETSIKNNKFIQYLEIQN